jgi:glycosyltransferase involved in cell wall biosynthesis
MKKKKLILFINHAAFFISHRLNIYLEAKKRGYDFMLITGKGSSKKMEKYALNLIENYKIPHVILDFNSFEFNLLKELRVISKLKKTISQYNPDIVHCVAPKPNLYGGLVCNFLKIKNTVISFSGMGFLFTGDLSLINKIKKILYQILLRYIFSNKKLTIICQNKYDYNFFKNKFNLKNNIKLIKGGSGININKYYKIKPKNYKNIVFSGRIVENKGVNEFILAAIKIKKNFPDWNFLIYGAKDYLSHDQIDLELFNKAIKNKDILYKGFETNIKKILKNTSIFCLPSYREGMPKSVMEASAAGIPSVVSDAIGSRDSILPNKTGLLFKNKDYNDLILKLEKIIKNKKLRNFFSKNAKKHARDNFSINEVTKNIFKIYEKR